MTDQVLHRIDSTLAANIDRLQDWLAIPSISTDPAYRPQMVHAARFLCDYLEPVGLHAEVRPTDGHPCVVAKSGPGDAPDGSPRVVFYGHYDVQPADPVEQWTTGPFEPREVNGAIVARGASDDKGQVFCFLAALRAWKETHGQLPCHVTLIIEGEEECGSPNLAAFLQANREELAGDVVLISDTTMWDRQTIAITYALRGLVYFDIQLRGPSRDLHSGVFGGTLPNPTNELMKVLGRLFDDDHRVTVPGFYDDVAPLSDDERRRWSTLGFDEEKFLGAVGVERGYGEAGYDLLERRWARPSCDVNGLYGGYGGEGAKTVIPTHAGAKVSFRLAANQDPKRIAASFEQWLRSHDVHGLEWTITNHGMAAPVMTPTDSPFVDAARRACEQTSGRPPVLVREGATIPVVPAFKQILGLDSILIGFGQTDDRIHSPNEKFELSCLELGMKTHAVLLGEIGKQ